MSTDEFSAAADRLEEVLDRIADAIGSDAEIEIIEDDDGLTGRFLGDDVAGVIGHHGQTLDAIQHLAYRIAFHREAERRRLTVDAGGYRERRGAALRATADQAADAAVRDGREVALDPMGAQERRLVHEHLKPRTDVETFSEGQEPRRRLVVAPLVEH